MSERRVVPGKKPDLAPGQEKWSKHGVTYSLLLLGPVFLFLVAMAAKFQGLTSPEAMDQAQLARNLARGEGFVTHFIRPLSLVFHTGVRSHPDLYNAPLYPSVLSLFFRVLGANDQTVVLTSGLFWLLSVWLTFWLAGRWFNRLVAGLATFLFAVNAEGIASTVAGREYGFLAVLLLVLLFCLHPQPWGNEDPEGYPAKWSCIRLFLIGLLVGLCGLTHYTFLVMIIPVGFFVFLAGSRSLFQVSRMTPPNRMVRIRSLGLVLLACLLVWLPWFIRNIRVVGTPFFTLRQYDLLAQTPQFPGQTLQRRLSLNPPSVLWFPVKQVRQMGRKASLQVASLRDSLLRIVDPYVAMFFLVGIFVPLEDRRTEPIRFLTYLSLLLLGVVWCFTLADPRQLLPFVPVIAILAAACAWQILSDFYRPSGKRSRLILTIGMGGLIVANPLLTYLQLSPAETSLVPKESLDLLRERLPRSAVIMSDVPWAVAWRSDRTSVWLCQQEDEYDRFAQKMGSPDALYLSPALATYPPEEIGDWWSWIALPDGSYKGLEIAPVLDGQEVLRVRRDRWNQVVRAAKEGG